MSLDDMVEKTSTLISSVIQKPKMTPKLLAKPPFRFLHDIFIGVTKATGLGEGLFEGDLLDSSKFQDNKEAKMLFLKRWIDFVSVSAGELLQADPRKIISGLDVENTNLMLQAFALLAVRVRDGLVSNAELTNRFLGTSPETSAVQPGSNLIRQQEPVVQSAPSQPASLGSSIASHMDDASNPIQQGTKAMERNPTDAKVTESITDNEVAKVTERKPITSDDVSLSTPPSLSRPTSLTNDNSSSDKSFVGVTQQKLGAIITRPTLKAELLQRPPLRFLQDVVREVHAATGCLGNNFQPEELTKKLEKDEKAAFLEKLVAFISSTSGVGLNINIKKVLAGQDPERTNELLQLLADIARQHMLRTSEVAPKSSAEFELKPAQAKTDTDRLSKTKNTTKETPIEQGKSMNSGLDDKPIKRTASEAKIAPKRTDLQNSKQSYQEQVSRTLDLPFLSNEKTAVAGVAPPKIQEFAKTDSKVEESISVPSGIILEGEEAKDDIDDQEDEDEDANARADLATTPGTVEDEKKHGRLVRDILKQQEKSAALNDIHEGQASAAERSAGIKLGRIGGKDRRSSYSQQMIDHLRENIQKVCQSVNPLGKCIDFVDEDLELMRLELDKWRQEQVVQKAKLEKEQKASVEFLLPLENDLQKIEKQIAEARIRTQKLRGNIIRNDDQLKMLLERQIKA